VEQARLQSQAAIPSEGIEEAESKKQISATRVSVFWKCPRHSIAGKSKRNDIAEATPFLSRHAMFFLLDTPKVRLFIAVIVNNP